MTEEQAIEAAPRETAEAKVAAANRYNSGNDAFGRTERNAFWKGWDEHAAYLAARGPALDAESLPLCTDCRINVEAFLARGSSTPELVSYLGKEATSIKDLHDAQAVLALLLMTARRDPEQAERDRTGLLRFLAGSSTPEQPDEGDGVTDEEVAAAMRLIVIGQEYRATYSATVGVLNRSGVREENAAKDGAEHGCFALGRVAEQVSAPAHDLEVQTRNGNNGVEYACVCSCGWETGEPQENAAQAQSNGDDHIRRVSAPASGHDNDCATWDSQQPYGTPPCTCEAHLSAPVSPAQVEDCEIGPGSTPEVVCGGCGHKRKYHLDGAWCRRCACCPSFVAPVSFPLSVNLKRLDWSGDVCRRVSSTDNGAHMTMTGVKLCPLCERPIREHPLPDCLLVASRPPHTTEKS